MEMRRCRNELRRKREQKMFQCRAPRPAVWGRQPDAGDRRAQELQCVWLRHRLTGAVCYPHPYPASPSSSSSKGNLTFRDFGSYLETFLKMRGKCSFQCTLCGWHFSFHLWSIFGSSLMASPSPTNSKAPGAPFLVSPSAKKGMQMASSLSIA